MGLAVTGVCGTGGGPGPGGAGGRSPPLKARAAGKSGDYRVLEAIFYRRLMPASVGPTTSKTAISAALKKNVISRSLGGGSETRQQIRKVQGSAALDDALSGEIGQQTEPK